ncbi:type II toxin-antitoxin system Phd/YefM family antitoxin [Iningainema tapete]|uniref:Antitoxin n=1 Tax=Iningainema tapete BLCC-T55 TaxID=2748662 RepID=A0A8J6XTV4_9CYAN|nr:type II toxin-antitoxin system prevent-host-death family antitoxin [Iningainema tapete]MBD2777486.1 type II toxin-antitoxin system prevent-host-death family antitoxin [Iningainema tapete BLCC-T55]
MFVSVSEVQMRLSQLLNQVEQGEEIIITREGRMIARLSPMEQTKRCLSNHAQLRASQPLAKTSSVEILQNLRTEARY